MSKLNKPRWKELPMEERVIKRMKQKGASNEELERMRGYMRRRENANEY